MTKTAATANSVTIKAAKVGPCKVTVKDPVTGKSASRTITVNPKGTKLSKLTTGRSALGVYWTKQTTQTTGYQIAYKYAGGSWKYKKVGASKGAVALTGLKSKTTYAVKIRTYKVINGKAYCSSWSSYKKATTK